MIKVENLYKSFLDIPVLKDLSFEVAQGEVLGFLGPNGAGKSTTMRIITGFLQADSGKVLVCDHDIAKNPVEAKKMLGYLPESAASYHVMRVDTFLDFTAAIRGLTKQEKKRSIERVVDLCNLGSVIYKPIEHLSKGFRQRVGLAQALIHDPGVLILDEATDGLDPNQKHEVRSLINRIAQTKAIIFSTHILEEMENICTRAIVIHQGQIVANGTPASFRQETPTGRLDDFFLSITKQKNHQNRLLQT